MATAAGTARSLRTRSSPSRSRRASLRASSPRQRVRSRLPSARAFSKWRRPGTERTPLWPRYEIPGTDAASGTAPLRKARY
eukprot:3371621-Rhodomonas_salina.4